MLLDSPTFERVGAMQVRAHAVVRVAGLPQRALEALCDPALVSALTTIADIDQAVASDRTAISEALHAAIGDVEDRTTRRALLQLRRALFRGALPTPAALAVADAWLPDSVREAVHSAVAKFRARDDAIVMLHEVHCTANARARAAFQRALEDEDFQKGLLLSSRTLSQNLTRYQRARADAVGSRDEQIERGLLRYFTRVVMKATPFARFCAIAEGMLEDNHASAPSYGLASRQTFDADPTLKRGHVRLDKNLYRLLWTHLKERPAVRASLVVEVNPTLTHEGERLCFLASVRGCEVFQRINRTEALETVLTFVMARSGEVTFGALVAALVAHPALDATVDEARAFLDMLLAHGLLRLRSHIPEQLADWDIPLCAALDAVDDEHARLVSGALAGIRVLADRYADANVATRERVSELLRDRVREVLAALELRAELPRDLPLYEDASTAARLHIPRTPDVDEALARLAEWIALTQPVAYPHAERAAMRQFYEVHYSQTGDAPSTVPLLRFYEDYYREHLKAHLEKEVLAHRQLGGSTVAGYDLENPFGLELVRAMHTALARLAALIRARWLLAPSAQQILLEPDAVREALASVAVGSTTSVSYRSASVFCQLVPSGAGSAATTLVLAHGQYFVGFGKYFSRFLYMLPEPLQQRVYADNTRLGGDALLAEICSDEHFNANLHPPLLPWEISYPTGESGSRASQLLSADMDVLPDPDDAHALVLRHRPTGARVLPVDLGFLNPRRRPPLFQLLTQFTPGGSFGVMMPETLNAPAGLATNSDSPTASIAEMPHEPKVVYRPRIIYANCIVLARRQWTVPGLLMPRPMATEADGDYLLRVDRWRRAHGIPAETYVRVIPEVAGRQNGAPHTGAAVARPTDGVMEDAVVAPVGGGEGHNVALSERDGAVDEGHSTGLATSTVGAARVAADYLTNRPSRDWYKPQYIDFTSPLLVRLFGHLPGALPAFRLGIEERYPDASALPTFDGDAYVTELVLQVDIAGPARAVASAQVEAMVDA